MFLLDSCTIGAMADTPREQVAKAVVARRVELGMKTTKALADRAGLTPRMLGDVENARRDNFSAGAKAQIENALDWEPGSIDAIFDGFEPTIRRRADRVRLMPHSHDRAGSDEVQRLLRLAREGRRDEISQEDLTRLAEDIEINRFTRDFPEMPRPTQLAIVDYAQSLRPDDDFVLTIDNRLRGATHAERTADPDPQAKAEGTPNKAGSGEKTGEVRRLADHQRKPLPLPDTAAARRRAGRKGADPAGLDDGQE